MITIGKIPQKVKTFFKPTKNNVSAHVYSYYCNLVIALCVSHSSTIDKLVKLLRGSTHRTNHGEFLWRSEFSEMAKTRAGNYIADEVMRHGEGALGHFWESIEECFQEEE